METTYSDEDNGGAFGKDVIPELTEIAQENEDFSGKNNKLNGGDSMPGTTWTMGAMFAQTFGIAVKNFYQCGMKWILRTIFFRVSLLLAIF